MCMWQAIISSFIDIILFSLPNQSVGVQNQCFMNFAPKHYRITFSGLEAAGMFESNPTKLLFIIK